MKIIFFFNLFIFINFAYVFAETLTNTEITTEDGVEVFQNEKYYLLKKNVIINSDNIKLKSNEIKVFFDKDLYDIIKVEAKTDANFKSKNNNVFASGEFLSYTIADKSLSVKGKNSLVEIESTKMSSNNYIEINNSLGSFQLLGKDSNLYNSDISIIGSKIVGSYKIVNNITEIENLTVEDKELSQIKTNKIEMFAKKAVYNKKNNVIELFDNVKIVRGKETIVGDYGLINLFNDSYSVKSNKTNKVKIFLKNE